ncbi:DUF692 family protein [Pseudenhygromyxa sp. WMMC2535]|uniref:DUF692 domain-containing protein n=1 Tax=Pseudenhygromyxa sp. WMMC2535 TaxID=2712867 RepID=UPI0015517071|nr:DUF692 family multinuclear iron-containing protein [Pseudenhygromyxa sp. WMMC2535]NVB40171.1 DUF692 family protein [Pseudenhygromyxa sp. WMMC2535]
MSRPRLAQTVVTPLRPLIEDAVRGGLLDAVEVVPDEFLGQPAATELLARMLDKIDAPYSFHFTQMSLGSPDFPDRYPLERRAAAIARFEPLMISDHLSAASVGSFAFEGNLPCVHDERGLACVVDNVRAAARAFAAGCECPFIVENIPCEFEFAASTMSPEDFTLAVLEGADCGLLLDLHNLYVHERNRGLDAEAFIDTLDPRRVRELHLAGGETLAWGEYVDGHCASIPARVIELLELTLARCSPTLIVLEREHDFDDHAGIIADLERVRGLIS